MPVRFDLLRHGRSEASHPDGDRFRVLTPDGAAAIRALGERLGREGFRPDLVLSSPYRRARDTAALVLGAAGVAAEVRSLEQLEPEGEPDELTRALETELVGARHVLLVGHQPLLGRLAERWCSMPCPLRPGELLQIERDGTLGRGSGTLVRRLGPD